MSKDNAYWDLGDLKPSNEQAEFASVSNVRFLSHENVRMYDIEGNVILCKCGKPAGMAAIGKEAFVAWCSDCSPMNKKSAKFVYKPPIEAQKEKLKDMEYGD